MIFIETVVFTAQIKALVSDEEYAAFQRELAADPEAGDVIAGTGGLRRIRMAAKGKGSAAMHASSTSTSSRMIGSRCCSPVRKA